MIVAHICPSCKDAVPARPGLVTCLAHRLTFWLEPDGELRRWEWDTRPRFGMRRGEFTTAALINGEVGQ